LLLTGISAKQPADELVASKKELDAKKEKSQKDAREHEALMRAKAATIGNIVGKNVPVSLTEVCYEFIMSSIWF